MEYDENRVPSSDLKDMISAALGECLRKILVAIFWKVYSHVEAKLETYEFLDKNITLP